MGDSGSLTIGYILGVLLVKFCMVNPHIAAYRKESIFLSITLLIVPIFDVCRVIIVRLIHKQGIFRPDKNHIHHKLMRTGISQHQALISILALAMFFIGFNMLCLNILDTTLTILTDICIYSIFNIFILNYFIRKNKQEPFV